MRLDIQNPGTDVSTEYLDMFSALKTFNGKAL